MNNIIKYGLFSLILLLTCYYGQLLYSIDEHLINYKSDILDELLKHDISWLKKRAELYNIYIDKSNTTNAVDLKHQYANRIENIMPNKTFFQLNYLLGLSLSKLNKIYQTLPNDIIKHNKDTSSIFSIANIIVNNTSSNSSIYANLNTTTSHTSSTTISSIKHKMDKKVGKTCPIIYNKCKKNVKDYPSKYTQCLNEQTSYEECMMCFNNKISSSNYVGLGFPNSHNGCNYIDLQLLCNSYYPKTCSKGKYLPCPCIDGDFDDNKYHLVHNTTLNKRKQILNDSVKNAPLIKSETIDSFKKKYLYHNGLLIPDTNLLNSKSIYGNMPF